MNFKNKMTEKIINKEEQAKIKAAEDLRKDRINNLESLLGYSGAKYLKGPGTPYGAKGAQAGSFAFNQFLTGSKAEQIRKNVYNTKVEEAQNYGTISQPEYTSNYELEKASLDLIHDAQRGLKLKDLGSIVKKISPGLKIEIPKELEDLIYEKIGRSIQEKSLKAKEAKEKYNPTKQEQAFFAYHETLTKAYEEFAGYSLLGQSLAGGYNSLFKQLSEEYAPKKEEDKKSLEVHSQEKTPEDEEE